MTTAIHKTYLHRLSFAIALCMSFVFMSCTKDDVTPGGGGSGGPLLERVIKDTAYGTDPLQRMDIFLPAGRTAATKVVIFIHGGGWEAGSKNDGEYLQIVNLIRQKWPDAAVANINYRLTTNPAVHYTEMMADISAAVNFLVDNKTSFITSDTLTMVGASAGAHLAMLYTYKYNDKNYVKAVADFFGPATFTDWEWYNTYNIFLARYIKDLLIAFNGAPWNTTLYDSNSPLALATAQSKPTIIFHGTLDLVVPLYQSQWLRNKLNTLNVPHEYYDYVDGHGFNPTNSADAVTKAVVFLKKHLR